MRLDLLAGGIAIIVAAHHAAGQTTSPAARGGGHALAYDSRRGMSMLYGDRGPDATTLWGWDGSQLARIQPTRPGTPAAHKARIRQRARSTRSLRRVSTTADEYSTAIRGSGMARSWTRVATDGPGPRASYAFAYDSLRRRVVLFGGLSANGPVNDTWGWDGVRWTKLADDGPSPRAEAGAVYDPRIQSIIIAGGFTMNRINIIII